MEADDTSVHAAAPQKVETAMIPAVEAAATTAAENSVLAGAAAPPTPTSGDGKVVEDSSAERAITDAGDASIASPSLAGPAFPALSPRSTECTGLESDAETETAAAAPTGATFLSGSVGADVFSSRTGGGPQPWPALGDHDSSGHVDVDFGTERRISVEEAAAFMSTGSTVIGGNGGRFATGSSWAMTANADVDQTVATSTAVSTESPSAADDDALFVGRPLFIGRDDFLSCPSVGMGGLGIRRVNSEAMLLPSFASSSRGVGVAERARDLESRRPTSAKLIGRDGGDSSGRYSGSSDGGAAALAEVKTAAVKAVVEGGAPSRLKVDSGSTGDGGGVLTTTTEENSAQAEEVVGPSLLVRNHGSGEAGKTAAAVVETFAAIATGHQGGGMGGSVVHEGNVDVVKISGGGGGGHVFATSDSAATSDTGGGGVATPPPRGTGVGGAVPSPGVTTSAGGGCCVVS